MPSLRVSRLSRLSSDKLTQCHRIGQKGLQGTRSQTTWNDGKVTVDAQHKWLDTDHEEAH